MPLLPNGFSISFGTSTYAEPIISAEWDGPEIPVIDTTTHSTTSWRTAMLGELQSPGSWTVVHEHDPNEQPPIANAAETITFTQNPQSGHSTGATIAASGQCTKWDLTIPEADEDKMTVTAVYTFLGAVTYTDSSV